jgi:hypothetical protein
MSFIQKLFTSRDNNANSANYVGQEDRLWYDPVTNTIRVSDGSTPGGSSITVASGNITFGDFVASGNTMTLSNPNESMNFVSTGNGSVNIYGGGGFNVHTNGANSNVAISLLPSGFTTFNVPSVTTGQTGVLIDGSASSNTGGPIPQVPGTMLRVVGNDGSGNPLTVDAYGTGINSGVTTRGARGTAATPTATQTGDVFGRFAGVGYGTTNFTIDPSSTGGKAPTDIRFIALENFTDSHSGSQIQFSTSPIGSATRTLSATIDVTGITSNANVVVEGTTNSTTPSTGALVVDGGAGIAKDVWIGGNLWSNNIITNYVGSANAGANLYLQAGSDSSGEVVVSSDSFDVRTTTNPNPVFQVNGQGEVKILTPTFDANTGAVSIVGSSTGNSVNPQQGGVMLHVTGQPGSPSRIYNDGAGQYAAFIGRMYNGTSDAPTQLLANQIIARFAGTPYTSGGWPTISTVRVDMVASENQSVTNEGSRIELWATPIASNTIAKIVSFDSNGITFATDGSVQNTAGIPLYYMANANGVATLDNSGKVPTSQLPAGAVVYKGAWDASTNTPTLADGTGTAGFEYSVSNGGTVNFGDGPITFYAGDFVIYSGTVWQRIPGSGSVVASFNTRTGAVTLQSSDVTTALGYTPYNGSTNPNGYVNSSQAAAAAPVQSFNTRTGAITLQSSDVTTALTSGSLVNAKLANSNVIIGNTTISLGSTVTTVTGLTGVTATTFTGNLSGSASSANSVAGANVSGAVAYATTANSVAGANVSGQVGNALIAGTVYTNAQPNITSVGTLTSLTVTGNTTTGNLIISSGGEVVLAAGTTGTAPIVFQSGTLESTANLTAGDMEYDGKVLYFTPNGTQRGILPSEQFFINNANITLGANTSAQSIFGLTNGVSVTTGVRYKYHIVINVEKTGAGSPNFGYGIGGTAVIAQHTYQAQAATNLASLGTTGASQMLSEVLTTNFSTAVSLGAMGGGNPTYSAFEITGYLDITTGGYINPQVTFSAAPGGAVLLPLSSMRIFPVGVISANTSVGTWS